MAWVTPKTDWVSTDYFNINDYQRIVGNLEILRELVNSLYPEINYTELPAEQGYTDLPYAEKLTAIETNLESINLGSYSLDIGDTQTFYANELTTHFDYAEVNRIESAMLLLYQKLSTQKALRRRLTFRLGGNRLEVVHE